MDGTVFLVIAAVMGMVISLTWAVYRTLTYTGERAKFDEALSILRSSEITELEDVQTIDADAEIEAKGMSWGRWWLQRAQRAGRVPDDPGSPGRFALGAVILGSVFGFIVFPGGPGGLVVGPFLLFLGAFWLDFETTRRNRAIEKQLPLLLSSLRSQMHAGVTVQSALMNVADDLPSPLGDEVRNVKRDVNVSIPLDQALDTLAKRVKSRQMQFLVSSIGIAVRSGSDLVPQLIVIEEIAEQRARIDGKIRSAIALAKPTAWLAAGAPALMFVFFSLTDPSYTAYFFGPGILLFLIAVILYVAGLFIIRQMVKNVENT